MDGWVDVGLGGVDSLERTHKPRCREVPWRHPQLHGTHPLTLTPTYTTNMTHDTHVHTYTHNTHLVAVDNRVEAVSHHDHGLPFERRPHHVLNEGVGVLVDVGGCLIHDQDLRPLQHGPG